LQIASVETAEKTQAPICPQLFVNRLPDVFVTVGLRKSCTGIVIDPTAMALFPVFHSPAGAFRKATTILRMVHMTKTHLDPYARFVSRTARRRQAAESARHKAYLKKVADIYHRALERRREYVTIDDQASSYYRCAKQGSLILVGISYQYMARPRTSIYLCVYT
jgi:hypothetical protein